MNNTVLFGGQVVVLVVDPDQLTPIQGNYLWSKKTKNWSPSFHGYFICGMFETAAKLAIKNHLYHDYDASLYHHILLNRLKDRKCTNYDWFNYHDLGIKDSISSEEW